MITQKKLSKIVKEIKERISYDLDLMNYVKEKYNQLQMVQVQDLEKRYHWGIIRESCTINLHHI